MEPEPKDAPDVGALPRSGANGGRRLSEAAFDLAGDIAGKARERLESTFGGPARTRVIVLLALVLALSSADTSTVGASATELRQALHIDNTDIGLLVSVTGAVGAVFSVPFGVMVDRFNRINLLVASMLLWGAAMVASAAVSTFDALLLVRLCLGAVTAGAGPAVASLIGDYFPSVERGKIYGYVLGGELIGAGVGFFITGDVAAISWRAAFLLLAIPPVLLAWQVRKLPEPARGGGSRLLPGAMLFVDRQQATRPGDSIGGEKPGAQESETTDTQKTAQQRGIKPDPNLILRTDPRKMNILAATRYVLRVRTNVILILSSACAYFFLTGIQTFGLEFVGDQYGVHTIVANLLLLVIGVGAVGGVLVGGRLGDALIRRGYISGRVLVAGVAAVATVALFIPPLLTRSPLTAVPYVTAAAFCLTAQNPPLDAARLDIMVPLLWGRAEGIRTFFRTAAQSLAPIAFGGLSDVLGNHHSSLRTTFLIMLLPLAASGLILLRGVRYYPTDVATAAASMEASGNGASPPPDSPEPPPSRDVLE